VDECYWGEGAIHLPSERRKKGRGGRVEFRKRPVIWGEAFCPIRGKDRERKIEMGRTEERSGFPLSREKRNEKRESVRGKGNPAAKSSVKWRKVSKEGGYCFS